MTNEKQAKPKKIWLIALIVLGGLILIIGAFLLGRIFTGKSLQIVTKTSPTPSGASSVLPSPARSTSSPQTSANSSSLKTPKPQWLTFRNPDFGYQIFYPEGAKIESGNEACVTIKTDYLYVTISTQITSACLRTGVGAEYRNAEPDELTILGKKFTAGGMRFDSASMGITNVFWTVNPTDTVGIEYGISISQNDGMSEETAHNIVKEMVESYQVL